MDGLEYVKQVSEKQVITYHGHKVNIEEFLKAIKLVIMASKILEEVKLKLFFESAEPEFINACSFNNCINLPDQFENYETGVKVINAVLNIASENKYLLETLLFIFKNKDIVPISDFKRSGSELFEALANISNFTGVSFEEMQIANYNKLNKRKNIQDSFSVEFVG